MTQAASTLSAGTSAVDNAQRLRRNISMLAGSQVVTWATAIAWTLYVPRTLGARGTGLIVVGWSVGGILTVILGLGTRTYMVKEIAATPSRAPSLLGTALLLRAISVVPTALIVVAFVWIAGYGTEQAVVLYLTGGWVLLSLFLDPLQAVFQGIERMRFLAYADIINKGALSFLAIVLVAFGVRATGLVAMSVVVMALVVALNIVWMRRWAAIEWRLDLARLRSLVVGSFAYWTFALFFTIYLWIDSVMLSVMTDTRTVGWYGVPTKLFSTLMFLPAILSIAWLPRLSASFVQSPEQLHQTARAPLHLMLLLSLPICAGSVLLADPLVPLLYGHDFSQSVPVFRILALSIPPTYLSIMANQVLIASNRQWLWTKVMAGATILNPALNFVLIRYTDAHLHNGAIGAAISLVVTELVVVAIAIRVLRSMFTVASLARTLRAALASVGMVIAGLAARRLGVVAEVAVSGAALLLLAAVLRVVTPDELRSLWDTASRALARRRERRAAGALS
jgi:O-antigen/teichoic acid export membrane protein